MTGSAASLRRPVPVHDLPAGGRPFHIVARPEERLGLARRFELLAVESLSAEGTLRPEAGGRRVRLEGRLVADVVQTCVVSLDPVPAHIDVRFERSYGWDVGGEWEDAAGEEVFLDLSDEPPEGLTSDMVDLGEAAAEQLALELDPYPRKPGALFTGCDRDEGLADAPGGPFAGLAGRRSSGSSGEEG